MSKNQELFRLIAVKALDGSRLQLSYADSAKFAVDLKDWIKSTAALRPLRDLAPFSTGKLGALGRTVDFGDGDIDLAGDSPEISPHLCGDYVFRVSREWEVGSG